MSKIIDDAVAALKEKMSNTSFEGSAKFEIETEGSIVISGGSVYASDDPADVTFTASVEIFEEIFNSVHFLSFKFKMDLSFSDANGTNGSLNMANIPQI